MTCFLRSLHDGVFVEDARDAAAQHVHNTAAEQVRDATVEQVRDVTVEQDGSYGSYGSGNGLPFYMKPVNR